MKKRSLVIIAVIILSGLVVFGIAGFSKTEKNSKGSLPELLPRKATLAYKNEWPATQISVADLRAKIKQNEKDLRSVNALAAIYLQEARITGNFGYYNKAVMKCVEKVLVVSPSDFEALSYRITVLLSRHQFAEALTAARQMQEKYPYSAHVYGMLTDAYLELGQYASAVEAADKMISIRPDIRSYSRVAYLREIHGDIEGAIEAMNMAVSAGAPGDENTEWCRVQTGKLYEQLNQLDAAEIAYQTTLQNRENFPAAITGLARISSARGDLKKALELYQMADTLSSDHTIKEGIAETFAALKEEKKAAMLRKKIVEQVIKMQLDGNEDMEMAHAYLGVQDYKNALEFALKEYQRRPGNIEVNETLALVYLQMGDPKNALPFIENALKTGCKKPALLSLAAQIKDALKSADKTSQ